MTLLFAFLVALFLTSVLVPPLMRLAPRLGLIDRPGPRKIHTTPVPLCGGLAIALSALIALLLWGRIESGFLWAVAAGALIVLVGAVDDARPLNYRWRLVAQSAACGLLLAGGIHFTTLPLLGLDAAPPWLAWPATLLFVLACTNAVNLADGMDGLAGGLVIPSLLAIAYLARQGGVEGGLGIAALSYPAAGGMVAVTCAALSGAVLGFLRFNAHPAAVFLGDAGSTFLGFATAVLAILLVARYNPLLSPAIVLPLMGVPLLDTIYAVFRRLAAGRSPFQPDKRHLHHQLLALGLPQVRVVAILYLLQGLFVLTALLLRYERDGVVLAVFAGLALAVILPLSRLSARRAAATAGGKPADETAKPAIERRNLWLRRRAWLPVATLRAVKYGIAGFILVGALAPARIPRDIAILAACTAGLWLAKLILLRRQSVPLLRIVIYAAAGCAAYLVVNSVAGRPPLGWTVVAYLGLLMLALIVAIRVTRREQFRVTPQDLLVLFLAIAVPNLSGDVIGQYHVREMVAVLIVLFYATEFVIAKDRDTRLGLDLPALAALSVVCVRGFL